MWTVLRSFESEAEARVVEAFLRANDIEVQLLGTHSHPGAVAPGSRHSAAMRLMVRQDQAPEARSLLLDADARAHLSVVTDPAPPASVSRINQILVIVVLITAAIVTVLMWGF